MLKRLSCMLASNYLNSAWCVACTTLFPYCILTAFPYKFSLTMAEGSEQASRPCLRQMSLLFAAFPFMHKGIITAGTMQEVLPAGGLLAVRQFHLHFCLFYILTVSIVSASSQIFRLMNLSFKILRT